MAQITRKQIKKVKLAKGRTLQIDMMEYLDDGTTRLHPGIKCDQLYHDDMKAAMDKLKPHFVHICDQKESEYVSDIDNYEDETLKGISVDEISISGSDDNEGVTIVGSKKIGDKVLNLSAPFTEFDSEYPYAEQLALLVEAIRFEASEYLFNGKYAVKQLEIEFTDPDSGEFQENANAVASNVLSELADKIIGSEGDTSITISGKKSSKRNSKKNNVVQMTSAQAEKVEGF